MRKRVKDMTAEQTSEFMTLPNLLSLMRVFLAPVFVWALVRQRPWLAFGIFLLAGATDALDGFTARFFHLKSKVGIWLDPLGDKILLTTAFVCLAIPRLSVPNALPLGLVVLCIGRDVTIALGALVYTWLRGRTTFKPTLAGKASTICQLTMLVVVLLCNGLGTSPGVLRWLYGLTAALTVLSGVQYVIVTLRRFIAAPDKAEA
jgi:cardiolipin synthase